MFHYIAKGRLCLFKKILIFTSILLSSTFLFAENFYINPVSGVSIDETVKISSFELLVSNFKEQNLELAKKQDAATFVIDTQIIKLGNSYIVTIQKSKEGSVLLSKKMKVASIEELDKAINRLSRSIVLEKDPNQEIRVGEITNEEQNKISKRTESFDFRTFAFGITQFTNLRTPTKSSPNIYLGTGYQFDVTEQSFIHLLGELTWRQTSPWATMWNAGLGYGHYFKNSQYAPYFSFDVGYGGALCNGLESQSGLTLGTQLGYGMFRTSTKQLNISARYLHLFKANKEGEPSFLGLFVSALF